LHRLHSLRPSPAMVVALIALFLSLGGVSYGVATGFIDSRELKNNTVSTKDLKNNDIRSGDVRSNTLTGSDINESRLGKVPSATSADSATSATSATNATTATSAGNASTVNGFTVRRIDYRAPNATTGTTILDLKGLTITADCTGSVPDNVDVTGPPGSDISIWGYDGDDATNPLTGALDIENYAGGTLQNIEDTVGDTSANSVGVQLTYHRNNGDVVTAQFNMDATGVPATQCVIGGTAVGG
jgi:hypothetical protein